MISAAEHTDAPESGGDEKPHDILKKVSKGGIHAVTPSRLAEIERDIVANLSAPYLEWADAELKRMASVLAEVRPGDDLESPAVKTFRRHIHETRGMGGTFGYPLITEIANHVRGMVHAHARVTSELLDGLSVHLDAIGLVIAEKLDGDGGGRGVEVLNGLQKVYSKLVPTPP